MVVGLHGVIRVGYVEVEAFYVTVDIRRRWQGSGRMHVGCCFFGENFLLLVMLHLSVAMASVWRHFVEQGFEFECD